MRIFLYLLLICNSTLLMASHDIPIAIFHVYETENTIHLDVTLDVQDLSTSLKVNANDINLESIQNYLQMNTTFQFNAKTAGLKILTFKIVKDHIRINGILDVEVENVNSVKIENTCLLQVRNHSNIIQMDLHDQNKDYRMHARRTTIRLEY